MLASLDVCTHTGRLKRYKEYLLQTVDAADLEEVTDLLNRYQTLIDLQLDLQRLVESVSHVGLIKEVTRRFRPNLTYEPDHLPI